MSLLRFATYDDYLDEMVSLSDMRYIGDRTVARELISLGNHSSSSSGGGDILNQREYELQREKERLENEGKKSEDTWLPEDEFAFLGLDDDDCDDDESCASQLMRAVAEREDDMRRGILTLIVFVRRKTDPKSGSGREVSAFIDLALRLKEGSLLVPSGDGAAFNGSNNKI